MKPVTERENHPPVGSRVKQAVALLLSLALVGCTSMRTVDHTDPAVRGSIGIGDRVIAYGKTGQVADIVVASVGADGVRGAEYLEEGKTGPRVSEVRWEDVTELKVAKVDLVKTSLGAAGTVAVVALVAVTVVAAGISGYGGGGGGGY